MPGNMAAGPASGNRRRNRDMPGHVTGMPSSAASHGSAVVLQTRPQSVKQWAAGLVGATRTVGSDHEIGSRPAAASMLGKTSAQGGRANVQVLVRDNNVDQALKALKKKMQREGIFREMKLRGHYEKPSEKKAREKAEAIRRARKLARKRLQREGLL